jgi:hypothetical protein
MTSISQVCKQIQDFRLLKKFLEVTAKDCVLNVVRLIHYY